ncbi:hypothetical protein N781_05245 [Pontibacillus halophilus JSM 076056 = DSM 19796]|uniref:Uncharacterized protein n=1 Tax=Pontibacillus halophilus JSM 076056 = DSM 19796 TaxID=1385510 RepID=A0A0A5GGQ1_9BACI|nr:hypothetical protein [Pontibacillus halophilus]KGX91174.1 hypothetical protein N781_05245 [Pontibacillus halophilus JSM 076056 = DSM 19796]
MNESKERPKTELSQYCLLGLMEKVNAQVHNGEISQDKELLNEIMDDLKPFVNV